MKTGSAAEIINKKKAVMFDLFHTLVTVSASGGESTAGILGVPRDDWNRELMEKTPGRLTGELKDPLEILRRMAHAIKPDIPEETIKRALENRIKKFSAALINPPGETLLALAGLKSSGKKIGLVSNAEVSEIAAWERSPLAPLFDAAVFSCYAGAIKPDKEIYGICMSGLNASPHECVFVGDGGSNELQGAKKLGITTIMITAFIRDMSREKIDERKKFADYVIENIDELLP
ncbi:MAG: HAD family hydrolase [Spirochaetes bacterium]|nr:HAD family hydrolase [Spirochaetota bacterium]